MMSGDDCRIRLVYLPAYAPNLNLIERLWWLFERKTLYNEPFPTFPHFKAAVDGFFANIANYRNEIQTLISGAFHYIGKQNPPASLRAMPAAACRSVLRSMLRRRPSVRAPSPAQVPAIEAACRFR